MNLSDLTREELLLINTDFGEEIEKQASAIVDDEYEKIAEVEAVAENCYNYGAELAMQKIAEMEANYAEKKEKKKEGKEDEDEDEKDEEKTASATGNFITEGYWNTLMEKGAEYYNDENIYIEELCKEAKYTDKALKMVKGWGSKIKSISNKAYKGTKKDMKNFGKATKKAVTGKGPGGGKVNRKDNLKKMWATNTGKGVAGLGLAGAAYGTKKALD